MKTLKLGTHSYTVICTLLTPSNPMCLVKYNDKHFVADATKLNDQKYMEEHATNYTLHTDNQLLWAKSLEERVQLAEANGLFKLLK